MLLAYPPAAAPHDPRERAQLRATYYGAQAEVDDQLAHLFAFLDDQGLTSSTLIVLTSDHGEMGGDHWLVEKCGYWDESFHIPLIVCDPTAPADGTRGTVVTAPTESVDVAPTILEWLGLGRPAQFDGWPLTPFLHQGETPGHWRQAAHWEWDFRHPQAKGAEAYLGIPSEHCNLAVLRTEGAKYVQFAAGPSILPPLLFDLGADAGHTFNLLSPWGPPGPRAGQDRAGPALALAQEMLRWRMRNLERTLSNCFLAPATGPVWAQDAWW
jgi:arylsulfatase A-like enzyme